MLRAAAWATIVVVVAASEARTQTEELLARQAKLEDQIAALQQKLMAKEAAEEQGERRLLPGAVASKDDVTALKTCLDYMWLLICGALVMFMQAGFSVLEAGSCRAKTAGMILTKNVMDACVGTLVWYIWGYAFAYGAPENNVNEFMGHKHFAGSYMMTTEGSEKAITGTNHFKDWFFQWAFCATAATIVSGGVAERIRFEAYVVYSIVMTGIIYPIVVWWTWSGNGWLSIKGYSDFAGSGIVHLTGGIGALVGAIIIKPRTGRFNPKDDDAPDRFDPHNLAFVVIGTFILWFGWYGFNCGSTLAFSDVGTATQAALVAMNTTISAATGGITLFILRLFRRQGKYDLAGMCNGILVGLVSVCAGVGDVMPWGALILGLLGAICHEIASITLEKLQVDDPLDAFAVHGAGGMIGLVMRPILDRTGAKGEMLGWNIVGLLVISAWSGVLSAAVFGIFRLFGKLRISEEEEEKGSDMMAQQLYRTTTMQKEVSTSKV